MRISDWSSDVCSSDLVEAALHRGESFGDAVDHLCPHEIVIAEMRGGAIPPHAAAVAVEDVGTVHGGACAAASLWRQEGMGGLVGLTRVFGWGGRKSEEHRAELHSLKRIYYDVYRWDKTN